jgi:TrpR-related protein YerC/YecD
MTEKNSRKNETVDALFDAILSLESREECYAFFEDLCTVKEISDMAQRLEAAKLLLGGRTYDQIVKEVEISTATISRINRCIQYGTGGYQSTAGDIRWGTPYIERMSPLWQRSIVPLRWNVRPCPVLP